MDREEEVGRLARSLGQMGLGEVVSPSSEVRGGRVIWDEAVLGDDGLAQCGVCGEVKKLKVMVWIGQGGGANQGEWLCREKCSEAAKWVRVKVLDERARLPRRAHTTDCGYDLFVSERTVCEAGEFTDVPCGIAVCLPLGHWGHIVGRSSAMRNLGLMVVSAVIDQGYTGPLFSGVWNLTREPVVIREGDRVAQLIVAPMVTPRLEMVEDLPRTDRGARGFGSSGR